MFGKPVRVGQELHESIFEPLGLLQGLSRLEGAPELFDSLPNTLSLVTERGTLIVPLTDAKKDGYWKIREFITDEGTGLGGHSDEAEKQISDDYANNDDQPKTSETTGG